MAFEMAPGEPTDEESDPHPTEGLGDRSLPLLELAFCLEDDFDLPPIGQKDAQVIRRFNCYTELAARVRAFGCGRRCLGAVAADLPLIALPNSP
ncbi:hypothetical protein ACWGCW_34380 [Streptomyces sp. NPDC054933]